MLGCIQKPANQARGMEYGMVTKLATYVHASCTIIGNLNDKWGHEGGYIASNSSRELETRPTKTMFRCHATLYVIQKHDHEMRVSKHAMLQQRDSAEKEGQRRVQVRQV